MAETSGRSQTVESTHHRTAGKGRHSHGFVFGKRFEGDVHGSVEKLCMLAVSFVCPVWAKLRDSNIGVQYDFSNSRWSLFLLPNLLIACCADSVLFRKGGAGILEAVQCPMKTAINN